MSEQDYLQQIEAERLRRAEDKRFADLYRKLRTCKTVEFANDDVQESLSGVNFDPARLDNALAQL